MTPRAPEAASVLVIDSDPVHRSLITAVLRHAGFDVSAVEDAAAAGKSLREAEYQTIVRDFSPGRRQATEELLSTVPPLLDRTVILTTAVAQAVKAIGTQRVFAVLAKPFDLEELVRTVSQCASRLGNGTGYAGRPTDSMAKNRRSDGESAPSVKEETLSRFVSSVPALRRLLSAPVTCAEEAMLRGEMRRTIGALTSALDDAARVDASRTRAAVLRAASTAAAGLMGLETAPRDARASGRGH